MLPKTIASSPEKLFVLLLTRAKYEFANTEGTSCGNKTVGYRGKSDTLRGNLFNAANFRTSLLSNSKS